MTALAITDPAPRAQHHASAHRRGGTGCGEKHASTRSRFCQDRRRPIAAAKPQVGSGVEPGSHRRIVGPLSFYDPATATFLTRDPLNAATRSPYGYVDGDPLNATDPAGLMGWHCDTSGIGVNAGKSCAEQAKEHNQQQASEGSGLCFNNPFSKSGNCISVAKQHLLLTKVLIVVAGGAGAVACTGLTFGACGLLIMLTASAGGVVDADRACTSGEAAGAFIADDLIGAFGLPFGYAADQAAVTPLGKLFGAATGTSAGTILPLAGSSPSCC